MTDRGRWARVKALFDEALPREAAARAAYLDEACGGDSWLRAEVESLLAAHEDAGSLADGSPLDDLPASAVATLGDALHPGAWLGSYEIRSKLGAGGMGEVYHAHDSRLGRDVAIKILPPEFTADPPRRARFQREASAIARLTHPNVCTLYDFDAADGRDFLVMEYVEGETLAARLARSGHSGLPLDEVLSIAIALAGALAFAHEHGVVHRDVKPGNVMLTRPGVKLLDFGLARLRMSDASRRESSSASVSDSHALVGTLAYMAPEQFEGRADARTDVFAFGAVLYEMLSGRRAFDGESSAALTRAVVTYAPASIAERRPTIPPSLKRVVRTCLEKDPDQRFQCAHDLRRELQSIAESHAGETPSPAPSRHWAGATIAVLIALAAGVAIGLWQGGGRPPAGAALVRFIIAAPGDRILTDPIVSPDGRHIVFVAGDGTRERSLWLRSLDSAQARELPGTRTRAPHPMYPFWSPDGEAIAFFADGKLKRLDIAGGAPVVICDAENARGGTWNEAGVILFAPTNVSPLMRVSAQGGVPQFVTTFAGPGETSHRWPHFLPDGDHFLYLSFAAQEATKSVLRVGSLESGDATSVLPGATEGRYADGFLFFVRDDVLMAQPFDLGRRQVTGEARPIVTSPAPMQTGRYSFSAGGSTLVYRPSVTHSTATRLTWYSRDGRALGTIGETGVYENPSIAPDQKRVAVNRLDDESSHNDVWVFDAPHWAGARVTTHSLPDNGPIWSPDARQIAFASSLVRGGAMQLVVVPADGNTPSAAIHTAPFTMVPRGWSSSRRLLFQVLDQRGFHSLWMTTLDDPRETVPFRTDPFHHNHASLSPDGRWVAYTSNRSGRTEVYVETFPAPGAARSVPGSADAREPRWGSDGRELYFLSADDVLTSVAIGSGDEITFRRPEPLFKMRLSPTRSFAATRYDVARDGRVLAVVAEGDASPPTVEPTVVVLNATTALRQGALR